MKKTGTIVSETVCIFYFTFLWPVFVTCYYNQVGETVYMFNLLFIDLFLLRVIIVNETVYIFY